MTPDDDETPDPKRRDLVLVSAAAFAGMGGLLALWPFVAHMNPDAGTPVPPRLDVDVQNVAPGQTIVVTWQGRPVYVRHRTASEIEAARAIDAKSLPDRLARNESLPHAALASDENRTLAVRPEWLLVVAVCSREGCILAKPDSVSLATGESFACPCCNARYDSSGRVTVGPAPANLTVPRYEFASPTRIRLL